MIFTIEKAEEFLKFAESCEPNRYQLYYVRQDKSFLLRPSKSSKNLDSAIYKGEVTDSLKKSLAKKFDTVTIDTIYLIRE